MAGRKHKCITPEESNTADVFFLDLLFVLFGWSDLFLKVQVRLYILR